MRKNELRSSTTISDACCSALAVTYGWERSPQFVAKKIKGRSRGPTVYDNTSFTNVWIEK